MPNLKKAVITIEYDADKIQLPTDPGGKPVFDDFLLAIYGVEKMHYAPYTYDVIDAVSRLEKNLQLFRDGLG